MNSVRAFGVAAHKPRAHLPQPTPHFIVIRNPTLYDNSPHNPYLWIRSPWGTNVREVQVRSLLDFPGEHGLANASKVSNAVGKQWGNVGMLRMLHAISFQSSSFQCHEVYEVMSALSMWLDVTARSAQLPVLPLEWLTSSFQIGGIAQPSIISHRHSKPPICLTKR